MSDHELTIVYNVLVIDEAREVRTNVRTALRAHRAIRVVGIAGSLTRACTVAVRSDLDIIVIGRVMAGNGEFAEPLAALRRLAPYARVVLFATDLPEEAKYAAASDATADVPDLGSLVDAVVGLAGLTADVDLRDAKSDADDQHGG